MKANFEASEPDGAGEAPFADRDDEVVQVGSDSRKQKALARLRAMGLAPSSGDAASQDRAREQWLRQLAEDFPDKFSRGIGEGPKESQRPRARWEAKSEHHNDAVLKTWLFVLGLHGDPFIEFDWELRDVWLSPTGRIWLDAPGEGQPTLYLGGHCVKDVQLFPVGQDGAVKQIEGKDVYALRIDFPGARFTRKKYVAAFDAATRDDWIRICSTLVPRKDG